MDSLVGVRCVPCPPRPPLSPPRLSRAQEPGGLWGGGTLRVSPAAFTALYVMAAALCVAAPPAALRALAAALLPDALAAAWARALGGPRAGWVAHHLRRTAATRAAHAVLALGYVAGLALLLAPRYRLLLAALALGPLALLGQALSWARRGGAGHPLARVLAAHARDGAAHDGAARDGAWRRVAAEIDAETRRPDAVAAFANGAAAVVVTASWILRAGTYAVDVARQRDAGLHVAAARMVPVLDPPGAPPRQILTIRVTSRNPAARPFLLQLPAHDYEHLQASVSARIVNDRGIAIQQTPAERLLALVRPLVGIVEERREGRDPAGRPRDICVGCLDRPVDVRARPGATRCRCRPMWCLPCLTRVRPAIPFNLSGLRSGGRDIF
jgi:hypothetical protein